MEALIGILAFIVIARWCIHAAERQGLLAVGPEIVAMYELLADVHSDITIERMERILAGDMPSKVEERSYERRLKRVKDHMKVLEARMERLGIEVPACE